MQGISPLNVDAVAKLVIQPIACNWNGCAAVVNSWHTFQQVSFICIYLVLFVLITLIII